METTEDTKKSGFGNISNALEQALADLDKQNQPLGEPAPQPEKETKPAEEEAPKEEAPPQDDDSTKEETPKQDKEPDEDLPPEEEDEPKLPGLEEDEEEVAPKPEEEKPKADEPKPPEEDEEEEQGNPYERIPKKRLERLKRKVTRETEERLKTEYDKKIAELEAKLQQRQSEKDAARDGPDGLTDAEREELLMLRRRVSVENDPEIKQQFDAKVEDNRATIQEVLQQAFPAKEDQERLGRMGPFDEWASDPKNGPAAAKILETLAQDNPIQADIIRNKIAENISLKRGKQRTIEERSKDAKEWFAKRNQEEESQRQQQEQEMAQRQQFVKEQFDRTLTEVKTLQPIPEDGLEGAKLQEVREQNKVRNQMRRFIADVRDQKYSTVKDGINLVFAAAKSLELKHKAQQLEKKVHELEEKLNQRKEAGTVSRQSRATATTTRREEQKKPTGDWRQNILAQVGGQ